MSRNFSTLKRRFRGNEHKEIKESEQDLIPQSEKAGLRLGGGMDMNDRTLNNMMKMMDEHDKILTFADDSDKVDETLELRPTP